MSAEAEGQYKKITEPIELPWAEGLSSPFRRGGRSIDEQVEELHKKIEEVSVPLSAEAEGQ